jgi:hypothetical protein
MKFTLGILGALLLSTRLLSAQSVGVTVELLLDQQQYLPAEDVNVAVKITNRSGQTLVLGRDSSWLKIDVQSRENFMVNQIAELPVAGEFSLESSLAGTKRLNITPYFSFSKIGRYEVKATVTIPQWNVTLKTTPKTFDLINGTILKEVPVGVPLAAGETNRLPEMRHFVLQQATYLKDNLFLYVRLLDSTGAKTLKVLRVGQLTSFSKPEAQIDSQSNLHLLFQTGARRFLYTVITVNGETIRRQAHDYTETRPQLRLDQQGQIVVAGGVRRPQATDIPSPPETAEAGR